MSVAQVLTNWKTVVSNSAQFRTLVGAADAAAALPYIVSFASDDDDKPANDDVVMYAWIENERWDTFGSTGLGLYVGEIIARIDIKQGKIEELQPALTSLDAVSGYVGDLRDTMVSQIRTYALESGLLLLNNIDTSIDYDEEERPSRSVWVINLTAPFGPR